MPRCSRIVEEEARRARPGEEDRMKLSSTEGTEEGRIGSVLAPCSPAGSKKKAAATAKKKATATATTKKKAGKEGAAKEGSTKRKAAAGSSKGKKAATGPAAAAGGVPEGEKHAADAAMAAAGEAITGGEGGGMTRLSQEYVDDILAWKPEPIQDPDEYYNRMINDPQQFLSKEYIDESTEIMRDVAEMTKCNNARFEKFQDWVRAEYKKNGYVEVDDTYIAQRVLLRQAMEQEDWDDVEGLEFEGDNEE